MDFYPISEFCPISESPMSIFADIGVMIPDIRHPDIGMIPTSEHRYSHIDPDIRTLRYLVSKFRYRTFHFQYQVQYRVQCRISRYRDNVGYPDIPISGKISGVSILGYGNCDIRYNIGYNIGYPDIGIPISDMISDVPTKHP